jgi:CubicO group peptidase (beta-lactamase class C family)
VTASGGRDTERYRFDIGSSTTILAAALREVRHACHSSVVRRFLHLLWVSPVVLLGVVLFYGRCDIPYIVRVLVRRDGNTDDHEWKRTVAVVPSPMPVPWREVPGCDAVVQAFAVEPDIPPLDAYLRQGGALALVVVRDGAITCEWYGNGAAKNKPVAVMSISKTVTSLVLARAVASGELHGLDESITSLVPELGARDPRFAAVTLATLVDMRSGVAFDDDTSFPWVNRDPPQVYYAGDLAETVVERTRIESPPGRFVYNDYAPNLIGLALERATRTRRATGSVQALWSELGAEYPAFWTVDDHGFAWHESGFVVTARDLARIGQLMLDDGRVGDRQVAPPAFLTRSFDPAGRQPATRFAGIELGYRNGWWVPNDDELFAMGRFGQLMLVSPASRTVIVRVGLDGHNGSSGLGFDGEGETNVSIVRRLERVVQRLPPRP